MPIATHPMTYEELLEFPNDGRRYEIHDGELIVSPSPDWRHQDVIANFSFDLMTFVRRHVPGGKVFGGPTSRAPSRTGRPRRCTSTARTARCRSGRS